MDPVQLVPLFVERVWGVTALEPWFPNPSAGIGEVWFTADHNPTSAGLTLRELMEREGAALLGTAVRPSFGGRFPILVKFLFTTEKLSVQVHPDDAYGEAHEGSPGKTEMWHVLHSEPGAAVAAGFVRAITAEELRVSVADGSVEGLLRWWPALPGDTFFVPAGTVHAVGGGLVICEIQQQSDITYRLWDYGRPRQLHVEQSMAVAELTPYGGPNAPDASGQLASCPYFVTEKRVITGPVAMPANPARFQLLISVGGAGKLEFGGSEHHLKKGECWLLPASGGDCTLSGAPELEILRVYLPA